MDDVTWAALTLTLTLLSGLWTIYAFRRRGLASGTRGLALTLLPAAAYLTGTLRLLTRIATAVGDWAVTLVLSPRVWAGVVLAGAAVVLLVAARLLDRRRPRRASAPHEVRGGTTRPGLPAARQARGAAPAADAGDPEMAEIEALLRKRGIS